LTKLFYGFGSVAFGVKDNGFAFFLLLYYNQVLGLSEAWVGFAIMIALIADAIFDPIVGYVSDHLHSRWGRRHPFMYASALPVAGAYYFLWNPPAGLPQEQLFAYLVAMAIFVRILIACYEIPSSSLVAELSENYDERTSILSYRYFFGWWGGLTMAVLAYSVFLTPDAEHPVGVLKRVGYQEYGLVAAVIMALAILISALGTHSYIPYLRQPPTKHGLGWRGALQELRQTLSNRAFFALFGAGIFAGMGAGIAAVLTIYFNTYFWELTSQQMSLLTMLNFVSAAVALATTPRLSLWLGKRTAAIRSALIVIVFGPAPIFLRLLGWFPDNGSPFLLPILAVLNTVLVALFITASILISSMLADVVENSEVNTGRRSEGVFFAANAFVQKSVSGIGIFASTLLLKAIDFPRGAQPGSVPPTVVRNLGLAYAPTFMVLFLLMLLCVAAYRISRTSHEATLQRLGRGFPLPPGEGQGEGMR
jgi:glycoside/pentoside/hexuronide:cation symporter, GPH family